MVSHPGFGVVPRRMAYTVSRDNPESAATLATDKPFSSIAFFNSSANVIDAS